MERQELEEKYGKGNIYDMKLKTARRFLSRNQNKIIKLNLGMTTLCPSFRKRIKEATRVVVKNT